MAESAVVAAVKREIAARGGWVANIHGNAAGETGIPDLLACYRGIFVAIETKHPAGGRLRPKQRHHLERIARAGGHAIVARSAQDVADILDDIDAKTARTDK